MTASDADGTESLNDVTDRESTQQQVPAEGNVVFPTGSIVECQTALASSITGQVLCYDPQTRLLVIRDTSGPKALMRLLNLALVEKVTMIRDRSADHVPYAGSTASGAQVQERIRKAEARKRSSMLQTDVSIEGQKVFIHLRKTLEDVKWQDENILVMDRVLVRPPYDEDSVELTVHSPNASSALELVRKILSRHRAPPETRTQNIDAPADPTPSR
ncbi:hypothetical protein AB6A40_005980 [Gnathostoma spinigerum]|uniref:AD domain-containing protein n=1 Tax=Gnathostoma spinigerum TaxID=75299 RepID=A0ABD6EPB4_9BILA